MVDQTRPPIVALRVVLRALILADGCLAVASGIADEFLASFPPALLDYAGSQAAQPVNGLWLAMLTAFGGTLVGWVGLWRCRPWGRTLYTAALVGYYCVAPFDEPTVTSALASACSDLSMMCSGGTLLVIWLFQYPQAFEDSTNHTL